MAKNFQLYINKCCIIKPLENLYGVITAVFITKKGIEFQVRYFLNGKSECEYFFDWEIQVLEENVKGD